MFIIGYCFPGFKIMPVLATVNNTTRIFFMMKNAMLSV